MEYDDEIEFIDQERAGFYGALVFGRILGMPVSWKIWMLPSCTISPNLVTVPWYKMI